MGIALHIFKKDLRRLWPLLGIMVAYLGILVPLLMQDLLAGTPPHVESASYLQSSALLGPIGLEMLTILMIVLLIHDEPLVGTSAFWLTRPIPRPSLMAAKGGFILIFLVAVPAAANLAVLFRYGLNRGIVLPSLALMLSVQLTFISLNAALAVITPSIQTFILAWGAAGLLMPLASKFLRIDVPMSLPPWITKIMVPETLTAAVSLIVILHQYRTRRTRQSAMILIGGLLLTLPAHQWENIPAPLPVVRAEAGAGGSIGLIVSTTPEGSFNYEGSVDAGKQRIFGAFDLINVSPGEEVWLTGLRGKLDFGDGNTLTETNRTSAIYGNALAGILPGYERAIVPKTTYLVDFLDVSDDTYREWGPRPGVYSGEAQFQHYRFVPRGELPLNAGSRLEIGSTVTAISDVERTSDRLSVYLAGRTIDGTEFSFYIVNRKLHQVLGPASGGVGSPTVRALILPGSFISYWSRRYEYDIAQNRYPFPVNASWLADAEVLVIERVEVGRFSRTFQMRDFRLSENTLERWQQRSRKATEAKDGVR
jgi:hypothetical protein